MIIEDVKKIEEIIKKNIEKHFLFENMDHDTLLRIKYCVAEHLNELFYPTDYEINITINRTNNSLIINAHILD